jgi:hypothetical protein
MSSLRPRKYILSLCYSCQKCLHCDKDCSKRRCRCQKENETPEAKRGQQRKHYSRTFQPNSLDKKPFNSWQLKELTNTNEYFGYKIDFSEELNFSLCPKCHSKFNRLGRKKEDKTQEEQVEQVETTDPVVHSSLKTPIVDTSSLETPIVDDTSLKMPIAGTSLPKTSTTDTDTPRNPSPTRASSILEDEELDADFSTNELKFKLVLKFPDGKCYPSKWEYIMLENFYSFKDNLENLVQLQLEDQIIFQDDYIASYKYEKESGLGTQLANARDWAEFLKEHNHVVSGKKTLMIIITMKKKSNKRTQSK